MAISTRGFRTKFHGSTSASLAEMKTAFLNHIAASDGEIQSDRRMHRSTPKVQVLHCGRQKLDDTRAIKMLPLPLALGWR